MGGGGGRGRKWIRCQIRGPNIARLWPHRKLSCPTRFSCISVHARPPRYPPNDPPVRGPLLTDEGVQHAGGRLCSSIEEDSNGGVHIYCRYYVRSGQPPPSPTAAMPPFRLHPTVYIRRLDTIHPAASQYPRRQGG